MKEPRRSRSRKFFFSIFTLTLSFTGVSSLPGCLSLSLCPADVDDAPGLLLRAASKQTAARSSRSGLHFFFLSPFAVRQSTNQRRRLRNEKGQIRQVPGPGQRLYPGERREGVDLSSLMRSQRDEANRGGAEEGERKSKDKTSELFLASQQRGALFFFISTSLLRLSLRVFPPHPQTNRNVRSTTATRTSPSSPRNRPPRSATATSASAATASSSRCRRSRRRPAPRPRRPPRPPPRRWTTRCASTTATGPSRRCAATGSGASRGSSPTSTRGRRAGRAAVRPRAPRLRPRRRRSRPGRGSSAPRS